MGTSRGSKKTVAGTVKMATSVRSIRNTRFPRGRVCEAPRAAYRVVCSRSVRIGFPGRYARAGRHEKQRRLSAWVTSSAGISRHECRANSARCPAWGIPQKQALGETRRVTSWLHISSIRGDIGIAQRDERECRKPPPWRCRKKKKKKKKKEPRFQVHSPSRMWQAS